MNNSNFVEGHLDLCHSHGLTAALAFRNGETYKTTPLLVGDTLVIYNPDNSIAFSGTLTGFDTTSGQVLLNGEKGQLFPWPADVHCQGHVFLSGIIADLPISLCLKAIAKRWRVAYRPTLANDGNTQPLPTADAKATPPLPSARKLEGRIALVSPPRNGAARFCFIDKATGAHIPLSQHDRLHVRDAQGNTVFNDSTDSDDNTNNTIINAQHVGQLFKFPNSADSFAFLYGMPQGLPANVWLTAVVEGWDVTLTPLPRLLDNSRLAEADLRVSGILEPFFETGTEGVIWSIYDPRCALGKPYEGLHCLESGDHLTVYERDGITVRWKGTVKLEYKRNWRPYPMNPKHGKQEVLGFWVHGLQEDLAPEDWAKMFTEGLPAVLRRRGTPKRCAAGKKSGKPNTCGSCNCEKKDK